MIRKLWSAFSFRSGLQRLATLPPSISRFLANLRLDLAARLIYVAEAYGYVAEAYGNSLRDSLNAGDPAGAGMMGFV